MKVVRTLYVNNPLVAAAAAISQKAARCCPRNCQHKKTVNVTAILTLLLLDWEKGEGDKLKGGPQQLCGWQSTHPICDN